MLLAVETILSGKAKIVITGGCDDIREESSYEFANMNATSNAVDDCQEDMSQVRCLDLRLQHEVDLWNHKAPEIKFLCLQIWP
jgi:hypothetical protein